MVLNPKTTSIAYRCPSCGYTVRGIAGAFGLGTQDMLRLRCSCGAATEMTIVGSADRRIRLTVPCLLCNSNHHYTLSDTLFYGKDVFHLSCPYTDINVGFIGRDEKKLTESIDKSTEELTALYEELMGKGATLEEEDPDADTATPDTEEEDFLPDPQIYEIVRFLVKELEADGHIHCPCNGGIYEAEMTNEGVRIYCPSCHAEYHFITNSVSAAQDFLSCDRLDLTAPKE